MVTVQVENHIPVALDDIWKIIHEIPRREEWVPGFSFGKFKTQSQYGYGTQANIEFSGEFKGEFKLIVTEWNMPGGRMQMLYDGDDPVEIKEFLFLKRIRKNETVEGKLTLDIRPAKSPGLLGTKKLEKRYTKWAEECLKNLKGLAMKEYPPGDEGV